MAFGLETDFYGHCRRTTARTSRTSSRRSGSRTRGPTTALLPGPELGRAGPGDLQRRLRGGGATDEPEPEPERKVRICHATSSNSNPYTSPRTGDREQRRPQRRAPQPHRAGLPATDWGDIIPPYNYVDKKGQPQTFPGYNWSPEGQAIWQNNCEPPHPPDPPTPKPITPILECVEDLGGGKFLAHFGYENPNPTTIEPPASENTFSPPPRSRTADGLRLGPRRGRLPGRVRRRLADLVPNGERGDCLERLGEVPGSITIDKNLVPTGRYRPLQPEDRRRGGRRRGCGRRPGDTTGTIASPPAAHTVSKSGAPGTSLADYHVEIICRDDGRRGPASQRSDPSVAGPGSEELGRRVHHHEHGRASRRADVSPVLECVVFNDGSPT